MMNAIYQNEITNETCIFPDPQNDSRNRARFCIKAPTAMLGLVAYFRIFSYTSDYADGLSCTTLLRKLRPTSDCGMRFGGKAARIIHVIAGPAEFLLRCLSNEDANDVEDPFVCVEH